MRVSPGLDPRSARRLVSLGHLLDCRALLHGLWILMIARRVPNLLVQVIQLLLMTLPILILIAAIQSGKVRILIQHLTLITKIFVYLLRVANHTLLIWVLRQVLQILLLLLRDDMRHGIPRVLALVR